MGKDITAYTVLGVERSATQEQIAHAYRAKALEHHPDRPGGDAAKMARVNLAWRKLGSPEERAAYDRRLLELERAGEPAAAACASATADEFSPEAMLEHLKTLSGAGPGELFAELGRAAGFLDPTSAERVRAAGQKGAALGKDIADLIGLVRGHQR